MDNKIKPFLVIKKSYNVKCLNCGWSGKAVLGEKAIDTEDTSGASYCPVCNHLSLVSGDLIKDNDK